jgi:hypothetical protein
VTERVLTGGCLCGAVRYTVSGRPASVGYCHCRLCRHSVGAPVVPWASYPPARVAWTSGAPVWYRSSAKAERGHCAVCGTSLAFRYVAGGPTVDITLASLDDPEALRPEYHIWTDSQLHWFDVADHLPRYPDDGPDVGSR